LLKDFSQVDLIKIKNFKKINKKVDLNVDPKVDLNAKNYHQFESNSQVNEPCGNCAYKDQILRQKDIIIESLQGQINALNRLIEQLSTDSGKQKKQAG